MAVPRISPVVLTDQQFARLRTLANVVVAEENRRGAFRYSVGVKAGGRGALVSVQCQAGAPMPSDPMSELGSLCDAIVTELRLERDEDGKTVYRTEETTFTGGESPVYTFEVHG